MKLTRRNEICIERLLLEGFNVFLIVLDASQLSMDVKRNRSITDTSHLRIYKVLVNLTGETYFVALMAGTFCPLIEMRWTCAC